MWLLVAGLCFSPLDAGMSVVPEGLTPAGETVESVPASLPVNDNVPLVCENPLDPRCAVQPGVPAPSHLKSKHLPDAWLKSTPPFTRSFSAFEFVYEGTPLAGVRARLERPPRV